MASQVEELMPVNIAKGCHMRIFIDHSKPTDHVDHNWSETYYDGQPDSELLQVPNHWHRYHDEIMQVLKGRMKFFVAGKEIIGTPSDGPILIPRGTVHGFTAFPGEEATLSEKTVPCGDHKALFFQDLFQAGTPGLLHAFRAFYDGDTYVSLPGGWKVLDVIVTTTIGFVAKLFVPAKVTVVRRKHGDEALGQ